MRHDESDKAQESDDGDGARCQKSRDRREQKARDLDAKDETPRDLITQEQDIELAREGEGEHETNNRIREDHVDLRPAARRQTADHPHQGAVHAVAVKDHQGGDARAEKSRDGDARQDDADRADAILPCEQIDGDSGRHRAEEGGRRHKSLVPGEDEHDEDARKSRPRRDADDVRVGEGILHDRLQNSA